MRFLLIIILALPNLCAGTVCDSVNGDIKQLIAEYLSATKNLVNTLMTTSNVSVSVKPDVEKVEILQKKIKDLASSCKSGKSDDDEVKETASKVALEAKDPDSDLQKMGIFENVALNTARINAIDRSNKFIGSLLILSGDSLIDPKDGVGNNNQDDEDSQDDDESPPEDQEDDGEQDDQDDDNDDKDDEEDESSDDDSDSE